VNPVIIHADGTDCRHEGMPASGESGPVCPAGQRITHVRFNGKTLTMEEAHTALQSVASAFAKAVVPLMEIMSAAFVNLGRRLHDDPRLRVLAAALAEAEAAARDEQSANAGRQ
jgi:hypothetical protein